MPSRGTWSRGSGWIARDWKRVEPANELVDPSVPSVQPDGPGSDVAPQIRCGRLSHSGELNRLEPLHRLIHRKERRVRHDPVGVVRDRLAVPRSDLEDEGDAGASRRTDDVRDPEKPARVSDVEARLLANLSHEGFGDEFSLFDDAAREDPSRLRIVRALSLDEQHVIVPAHDCGRYLNDRNRSDHTHSLDFRHTSERPPTEGDTLPAVSALSAERHVVAMGGGGFSMEDPLLDRFVLSLVDRSRPRICLLPTASSNVASYVASFLDAFPARSFEPVALDLFQRPAGLDLETFFTDQDILYVGGGSTLNLLAVWRAHGADRALRTAWENGVVLCGVSAGANCWFEASATDSFGIGTVSPLRDGLGLVGGSFCPHYDGEPERRPGFERMIADGDLEPGLACDDFAAAHFVGIELQEVVSARARARAYRVAPDGDGVRSEEVPTRVIG
jgi:dipeptidase E